MSRIFEALRRADRERRAEHEPKLETPTNPLGSMELGDSSSAIVNVITDHVSRRL